MRSDDGSATSSVITVRPAQAVAEDHRTLHQREPNTAPTPDSAFINEASYFTAATPSTFPDDTPTSTDQESAPPVEPSLPVNEPLPDEPVPKIDTVDPTLPSPRFGELPPRLHRFSLVKSGTGKKQASVFGSRVTNSSGTGGWSPLDLFFGSGWGMGAKCDLCAKRLGWKPVLECDDCGLK